MMEAEMTNEDWCRNISEDIGFIKARVSQLTVIEARVSRLEQTKHWLMGVIAVITVLFNTVADWVKDIIHGH